MNETEIKNKIGVFINSYTNSKDGGNSFVINIAKEFNSYKAKDRKKVIHFLINELQKQDYEEINLVWIDVLGEMRAFESAIYIYALYNNFLIGKDDFDWEKYIVRILLILRYKEADELYIRHFENHKNAMGNNGYLFFLGVLYCRANKNRGIDILADYFCKHLVLPDIEMIHFFENRMGFLIQNLIEISTEYIIDLIRKTASKNQIVGYRLKSIIVSYLQSNNISPDQVAKMEVIADIVAKIDIIPPVRRSEQ
ncbi:MAG: hypothetical protein PHV20_03550 [Bacteroidales bacterium]|nr:hypothetical protein [Bacteroidales bacterium]